MKTNRAVIDIPSPKTGCELWKTTVNSHTLTHTYACMNAKRSQTTNFDLCGSYRCTQTLTSNVTHKTLRREKRKATWEGKLSPFEEERRGRGCHQRLPPVTWHNHQNLLTGTFIGHLITMSPFTINNPLYESIVPGRTFPTWRQDHTFTPSTGCVLVQWERQRVCLEVCLKWSLWRGGFRT